MSGDGALRLAGFGGEFLLKGDERRTWVLGEFEGLDEFLLGQFLRLALDHDDLGFRADIDDVEVALFALCVGGIDDKLAIDPANAHGANGAGKRDVGDHQRGGSAVDGEDVGIVLPIGAQHRGDDLGIVEVALREERPQRAVRHAGGEDFLLAGTAFALEVAAGDFADGRGFLAVIDREREEILAGLDLGGGDGGDDDNGIAGANGDCAIGETGKFAGFDGDFIGADVARDCGRHGMYWKLPRISTEPPKFSA